MVGRLKAPAVLRMRDYISVEDFISNRKIPGLETIKKVVHAVSGNHRAICRSLGQFKRLLKTYLFGGWDRGAL